MMEMDRARSEYVAQLFARDGYQALVCRLPQHVVMLTGYLPVLGNSFCVVSLSEAKRPEIRLAVPQQERDLIPAGTAVEVQTFAEETMDYIGSAISAAHEPLGTLFKSAGLRGSVMIGYEGGRSPVATAYTQVGIPGPETLHLLQTLLPDARLQDASALLAQLAAVKTEEDLRHIRRCEEVAHQGFQAARAAIHEGATEGEVAAATCGALLRAGHAVPGAERVLPYVHVMAGARSAEAYKAFNLTTNAVIQRGDIVSVQMEVSIDGYWAELTRPFLVGDVAPEWRRAHQACVAAQDAALHVIRDGVAGHEADRAARNVMREAGFGDAFKHGLGHGFGFQAINHAAIPVLHPASSDVLHAGMVHNMEPAVYLAGKGGFRLNDNVVVRQDGNEVLSAALPRDLEWLVVTNS